jgi:hypothetical protein
VLAGMNDPMVTAFWEHQWPKGKRGATPTPRPTPSSAS